MLPLDDTVSSVDGGKLEEFTHLKSVKKKNIEKG